jgi:hypothetical protein
MYSFSLATEIFLLGYICVFDENAFSNPAKLSSKSEYVPSPDEGRSKLGD